MPKVLRAVGLILFLGGIALGVFALFQWLRTGINNPPVLLDLIAGVLPRATEQWLARPGSWIGLQRIVAWALDIPVFAWLTLAGMLVLLVVPAPRRV